MRRLLKGSAILSALMIAAFISLLLAGAATFVLSHSSRAQREKDYQAALTLAEAGINKELHFVSLNLTKTTKSHPSSSPLTGTVPGIEGTYVAWVEPTSGTGTWAPPHPMIVKATGTVGGVTRMVSCQGQRQGIFATYSVFGTNSVTVGSSTSKIEGNMGTNGVFSSSSQGTSSVTGDISYNGPNSSGPTGSNAYYQPDPVIWPSVDTIVASTFPGGWSWLTSTSPLNRSNAKLRQYSATNPSLTPAGTISANWPATGPNSVRLNTSDVSLKNAAPDGIRALIFPPGDYYFTNIQISGPVRLIMDTAGLTTGTPGQVRIWMNGTGINDQQDTINCDVYYTSQDPRSFRLYYNKAADLSISGNSTFVGGFYGVRTDGRASITLTGGSFLSGSVIGNNVTIAGSATIRFPLPGFEVADGDYALWYGFSDQWKELAATGNRVFVDGTNN